MNAHEVALALVDQLDELVVVRLGFLAAVEGWDIGRSHAMTRRTALREMPSMRAMTRFAMTRLLQG
ncbi:MAG: hypothetical protein IPI67_00025 [Myxococcales bacterium]|nr:hypothetical protein [Myxococcales bacterium]